MAQIHPKLKDIPFPLTNLAAVYILTGGDYISGFFRTSKKTFTSVFIENLLYVCSGGFVDMQSHDAGGNEGYVLNKIVFEGWVKLVCSVYLYKHKTLFNSEPIPTLHASLTVSPLPEDKVQIMKWLAYTQIAPVQNLSQWHDFTRRVCFYHSSGSKDHECLLVPSLTALRLHMLRSEYVLKIVFHSCNSISPVVDACEYGWTLVDNQINVVWDEDEVMDRYKANKGCGCRSAKCDGSVAGCSNCYQMCRPCTMKCKCKLACRNPHNNGGSCPRCALDEHSEDSDSDDDGMLPILQELHDSLDTDSDDSDGE